MHYKSDSNRSRKIANNDVLNLIDEMLIESSTEASLSTNLEKTNQPYTMSFHPEEFIAHTAQLPSTGQDLADVIAQWQALFKEHEPSAVVKNNKKKG